MIKNKKDYKFYVEADRLVRDYPKKLFWIGNRKEIPLLKYQTLMRKVEYHYNCKKIFINKIITLMLKYRYKKLSIKYGFSIPINTFGHGAKLFENISIGNNVVIGANSVVNKSFQSNVTIVGVPAIVSNKGTIGKVKYYVDEGENNE